MNQNASPKRSKKSVRLPNARENAFSVFLRVRPLCNGEKDGCISLDGSTVLLHSATFGTTQSFEYKMAFGPECGQAEVFEQSIDQLLPVCAEGRDLLFFAYGITGSGKTFSIQGTDDNPGLLPRTLLRIMEMTKSGVNGFSVFTAMKVSCFEIFNEKIYDLLDVSYKTQKQGKSFVKNPLSISRGADGKTIVENLQEFQISDESQIDGILKTVKAERHIASTTFNRSSTRSHVVFKIVLNREGKKSVCISIVDLAGSERTKNLDNSRIQESVNINKSNLVLGKCIRSLAAHQQAIPYRESLLTRIFKDFFESPGRCAVAAVLVNITPSIDQFEETEFSLNFAGEASNCSTSTTNDDDPSISKSSEESFQYKLTRKTLDYLSDLEDAFKTQVDELLERTRSANVLVADLSEYVSIADYNFLKRENEQLKKQLKRANDRINELLKANHRASQFG